MEHIYELTLPPISEVFLDNFSGFNDDPNTKYSYFHSLNVKDVFKPEWLNFLGFDWRMYGYWKKDNHSGIIHTDSFIDNITASPDVTTWGINWVWDGDGKMEFWDWENVELIPQPVRMEKTNGKSSSPTYTTSCNPDKVYDMTQNKAYLVNATYPHRPSGYNNRKVIALRVINFDQPWESIVKKFEGYIKNKY